MSSDPACVSAAVSDQDDSLLVDSFGGVRNVFVQIKGGLDASWTFEVPDPEQRSDAP